MKCWHCGKKTRNYQDAYLKFAYKDNWMQTRIWICAYCYGNLRLKARRILSEILIKEEQKK